MALAVRRAHGSLLFGVSPIGLLIAVACFASYIPARNPSRIEPMATLRTE